MKRSKSKLLLKQRLRNALAALKGQSWGPPLYAHPYPVMVERHRVKTIGALVTKRPSYDEWAPLPPDKAEHLTRERLLDALVNGLEASGAIKITKQPARDDFGACEAWRATIRVVMPEEAQSHED